MKWELERLISCSLIVYETIKADVYLHTSKYKRTETVPYSQAKDIDIDLR